MNNNSPACAGKNCARQINCERFRNFGFGILLEIDAALYDRGESCPHHFPVKEKVSSDKQDKKNITVKIVWIKFLAIICSIICFPFVFIFGVLGEIVDCLKNILSGGSLFRELYKMWCRVFVNLIIKEE